SAGVVRCGSPAGGLSVRSSSGYRMPPPPPLGAKRLDRSEPADMVTLAAGLVFIPLADQALKLVLRRRLGPGSVPLGRVGGLRVLRARIWLARRGGRQHVARIWTLWLVAAGPVGPLCALFPSCGWFAGLLLGGSLSHALESSMRGSVSDYVCLRVWPAFNLADVAITVGAIGVLLTTFMAMRDLWS